MVRSMASSKLAFTQTIKLLLGYSLVEGTEGLSSYATHPVVHEWAWHMLEEEGRAEYCWLATVITGEAVPYKSEKEFWVLQRRLLPHADRCVGCDLAEINNSYDKQRNSKADILALAARHSLGNLYADQDKLGEAEKMYQRALDGYEKAWGPDHTSTLATVNNLGLLYVESRQACRGGEDVSAGAGWKGESMGPGSLHPPLPPSTTWAASFTLIKASMPRREKMYRRALDGKGEQHWGPDHTSTLATVNNLGLPLR